MYASWNYAISLHNSLPTFLRLYRYLSNIINIQMDYWIYIYISMIKYYFAHLERSWYPILDSLWIKKTCNNWRYWLLLYCQINHVNTAFYTQFNSLMQSMFVHKHESFVSLSKTKSFKRKRNNGYASKILTVIGTKFIQNLNVVAFCGHCGT